MTAYHAYFPELTLLLIPLAIVVARAHWNRFSIVSGGLVFLAAYVLALLGLHGVAAVLCTAVTIAAIWKTRPKVAVIAAV